MANPVLSNRVFDKATTSYGQATMTIKGTVIKSLILTFMVLLGASYTWREFYMSFDPSVVRPWMIGGALGGFVSAIIISFNPKLAQYLAPVYAVLQGLFLGAISAFFNEAFSHTAPDLVINAVLLTIVTTLVMLTIYRSNLIKVNSQFRKILTIAISSIVFYYLISIILSFFGVNLTMLHNSSPLSIGISLVIVGVAAFSLLMDFDFIEKASYSGAPKYMEWYGAFALMVTIIWLYLEILKLLAKFAGRRD